MDMTHFKRMRIEGALRRLSAALMFSTALIGAGAVREAAAQTWDGDTNTTWGTGTNWVGDVLPAAGGVVVINNGALANQPTLNIVSPALTATNISAGTLTVDNVLTSTTVTLSATGNMTVNAATGSVIGNIAMGSTGALNNNGVITGNLSVTNGVTTNTGTVTSAAAVTVNGAGAQLVNTGATAVMTAPGFTVTAGTLRNEAGATLNGAVTNSGTFTQLGASTLNGALVNNAVANLAGTINGTVTNTGTATITANVVGVTTFANNGGTTTVNGGATLNVGTFVLNGGSANGPGAIAATTQYDLRGGDVGAVLTGAGALVKTTAGAVNLNATNTFTGGVQVNAGPLVANGANALSTGAVTVNNGGGLTINAVQNAPAAAYTVNAGGVLFNNSTVTAASLSNAGTVTNTGSFTAGTIDNLLGGALTNTGTLGGAVANAGTLFSQAGGSVINGSIVNTGGANLAGAVNGAITNNGGGFLNVTGALAGVTTLTNAGTANVTGGPLTAGSIANTGTFTIAAGQTVNTTTTYTQTAGATNIAAGATLGVGTTFNQVGGTTQVDGRLNAATVTVTGGLINVSATGALRGSNNTLTIGPGTVTSVGVVSDATVINVLNTGTLNVAGVLASPTINNAGVVTITGATTSVDPGLPVVTTTTFNNNAGGQLNVNGGDYTGVPTLNNAGTVTVAATRALTVTTFNNNAGGTLANAGTVTATTLANSGTVNNTGTIAAAVNNAAAGVFTTTGAINGAATNAGAFNAQGAINGAVTNNAGTFTVTGPLAGVTTFTNAGTAVTNVTGGDLTANAFVNAAGTTNILAGRQIVVATNTISGGTVNGPGAISAGAHTIQAGTIGAVLAGAGALTKTTGGVATLSATNTYAGGTDVQAGTLNAAGVNSLSTGNVQVRNGALLAIQAGATQTAPAATYTVDAGGTFNVNGAASIGTLANSGATTNTSALTATTVTNAAGGTLTNSATLTATNPVANAGTFTQNAAVAVLNGSLANTGTANLRGAVNGAITNSSVVNVTNPLTGVTTFTNDGGAVNLAAGATATVGTFVLNNGAANGPGSIIANTAFDLRGGNVSAVLAGGGALAKTTAGTVNLTATNTYTGGTTVTAGSLVSGAANGLSTGPVTINGGSVTLNAAQNSPAAAYAVNAGGSLFNNAALTVATLTNAGFVSNAGTVVGAITNAAAGSIVNAGALNATGPLNNAGTLTNTGSVTGGMVNTGALNTSGSVAGGLTNTGAVLASGSALGPIAHNGGTFTVTGPLAANSTFVNAAPLALNGALTGVTTFTNTAAITGAGSIGAQIFTMTAGSVAPTATVDATTAFNLNNVTMAGRMTGAGALNSVGAVALTNNLNAYTGATTVQSGVLTLNGGRLGTGLTTVNAGAGLDFAGAGGFAHQAPGGIVNNGAVTLNGVGSSLTTGAVTNNGAFTLAAANQTLTTGAFTNNATLSMGRVGQTATTGAFNNTASGVIDMTNAATTGTDATGNRLTTSTFTTAAGSRAVLDVTLAPVGAGVQSADRIAATAAGGGGPLTIQFNQQNFDARAAIPAGSPIVVLQNTPAVAVTTTDARDPVSGEIPAWRRGAINYFFTRVGNDWVITSQLDVAAISGVANSVAGMVSSISSGFHQPASILVSRPDDPKENQISGGPWVRAAAGTINSNVGGVTTVAGGAPTASTSRSGLNFGGVQGGADAGVFNINGTGWDASFGVMGGVVTASARDRGVLDAFGILRGAITAGVNVPYVGIYSVIANGPFRTEFTLRRDFLSGTITNETLGFATSPGRADLRGHNTNFGFNVSYNIQLGNNWFLEPSASFAYSRLIMNDLPFNGAVLVGGRPDLRLEFRPQTSMLGRLGVTVGTTTLLTPQLAVQPFASAAIWREMAGRTISDIVLPGANGQVLTERVGTYGQIGLGVGFRGLQTGLLGFLRTDFRFGPKVNGFAVNGGMRYQF